MRGENPNLNPTFTSLERHFEVQLFDEQGDKQDRFQTKPADKAVAWKNGVEAMGGEGG